MAPWGSKNWLFGTDAKHSAEKPLHEAEIFKYWIFVSASHQTGFDIRSMTQRSIIVGVYKRGRSDTSWGWSPAELCCSLAHLVLCGLDEPCWTWTQIWVQARMPDSKVQCYTRVSVMQLAHPKVTQPKSGAFRAQVCHRALTVQHGCQTVRWKTSARSRNLTEPLVLKKHDVLYSSKILEVTWYEPRYNISPRKIFFIMPVEHHIFVFWDLFPLFPSGYVFFCSYDIVVLVRAEVPQTCHK